MALHLPFTLGRTEDNSPSTTASDVGIAPIDGLDAENVQDALEEINGGLNDAYQQKGEAASYSELPAYDASNPDAIKSGYVYKVTDTNLLYVAEVTQGGDGRSADIIVDCNLDDGDVDIHFYSLDEVVSYSYPPNAGSAPLWNGYFRLVGGGSGASLGNPDYYYLEYSEDGSSFAPCKIECLTSGYATLATDGIDEHAATKAVVGGSVTEGKITWTPFGGDNEVTVGSAEPTDQTELWVVTEEEDDSEVEVDDEGNLVSSTNDSVNFYIDGDGDLNSVTTNARLKAKHNGKWVDVAINENKSMEVIEDFSQEISESSTVDLVAGAKGVQQMRTELMGLMSNHIKNIEVLTLSQYNDKVKNSTTDETTLYLIKADSQKITE